MFTLEQQIQSYAAYCSEQLISLSQELAHFPPGHLASYKNGSHPRYKLLGTGGKPVNVSVKDTATLERMARKLFFEARQTDITADLALCGRVLDACAEHPHAMETLLQDHEICKLLTQKNPSVDLQAWINADYPHNPNHIDNLTIDTEAGFRVRSKSEGFIVSALLDLGIPFHYEEELIIDGIAYYPDFTLLHPQTRRIFLLEHFGMMDDPEYARKAFRKIQLYSEHGYRIQDNLICFFEYKTRPLSIVHVKNTLEQMVLGRT